MAERANRLLGDGIGCGSFRRARIVEGFIEWRSLPIGPRPSPREAIELEEMARRDGARLQLLVHDRLY